MELNFDLLATTLDSQWSWYVTSVVAVFLFLILFSIRFLTLHRVKKNSRLKLLLYVFTTIPLVFIILLWIVLKCINPNYLGYGYATQTPTTIVNTKHIVWLLDRNTSYQPEMGAEDTYRIQGLNLSNGKKLFRRIFDTSVEIRYTLDNKVWVQKGEELMLLELKSGKTIQIINQETLGAENPSIKGKVYKFYLDTPSCRVIVLLTDGSRELINTIHARPKVKPTISKWQLTFDGKRIITTNGQTQFSLNEDGVRSNLLGINQQPLASKLYFLNGKFIAVDAIKQHIYLFSEEQLGGNRSLLYCISEKGKLLWKHSYTKKSQEFSKEEFTTAFIAEGKLVVQVNGIIMCLDSYSGKTKWSIRI